MHKQNKKHKITPDSPQLGALEQTKIIYKLPFIWMTLSIQYNNYTTNNELYVINILCLGPTS